MKQKDTFHESITRSINLDDGIVNKDISKSSDRGLHNISKDKNNYKHDHNDDDELDESNLIVDSKIAIKSNQNLNIGQNHKNISPNKSITNIQSKDSL